MGYFSNGSEGMDYEDGVCLHCKHAPTGGSACAVLMAHSLWNYEALAIGGDKTKAMVLEAMIPRLGLWNDVCTLFAAIDPTHADAARQWHSQVAQAAQERDARMAPKEVNDA